LKDLEGKVDEAEVKKATDAKDALKEAIEKNDLAAMKEKKEALQEIVQALSVKLYEQAAQAQQQGQDGAKQADDVVDAEFTEVDDDKK